MPIKLVTTTTIYLSNHHSIIERVNTLTQHMELVGETLESL